MSPSENFLKDALMYMAKSGDN